ncbi:MAG: hypothetical protein A3H27_07995 [Acidobacteria bacterium RIFCSPLOWO2_02_FULL_59_13]|nr:MAG: hypothetical protein A3H27_07995 [Acidobacteria bacterium RIFCSPLOWO2_02_FULL_59_13]
MTIYLPRSSQSFVFDTVTGLTRGHASFLSFGMVGTAWAASTGLFCLMNSLNIAYEVEDTRGVLKRAELAFCILSVIAFSFLGSFALLAVGDWLNEWLVNRMGFSALLLSLWHLGRWLLSLLLLAIGLSALDHRLPDVQRPWRWVTPGTVFAVLSWLPASLAFDLYVRYLANYVKTYGTLATFVILMVWIYILSLITLIGAEINSELWKMREEIGSSSGPRSPGRSGHLPDDFIRRQLRAHES